MSCNESLGNFWIRGESKNDEFAEYHVGAWKRTNEMHPRINMFHLAVRHLFTDYKMYILLALLRSWGELDTEESGGVNEFGSGKNQRMKTEKKVL